MLVRVLTLAGLILASTGAFAQSLSGGQWVDLTHSFNEQSVYWPTAETFRKTEVFHGHTEGGWFYAASMRGSGTWRNPYGFADPLCRGRQYDRSGAD